jgi:hypothetical protein
MTWAGHVVRMGKKRHAYRILVRKPEGKWPLERPRCRWMGNIKMDLKRDRMGWSIGRTCRSNSEGFWFTSRLAD